MIPIHIVMLLICVIVVYMVVERDSVTKMRFEFTQSLYNATTSLRTVTKSYEFEYKNSTTHSFTAIPLKAVNNFKIDDSDVVYQIPNLTCKPSTFGYSVEDGKRIFEDYTYPNCSEKVKGIVPEMRFDYTENLLFMSCKLGTPYYVLEPINRKGRLFQLAEISGLFQVEKYKKPVRLTVEEFALGGCSEDRFNNAIHIPRYNQTAHKEVRNVMNRLKPTNKPLIVLMLTIDSYSRRHFFRKLPKMVKYLNELENYSVFDFKIHNIFGESSVDNMVPIFTDGYFKDIKEVRDYDTLGNDSMWRYFKSKGFITLFGLEDCDFYFPNTIGRYPEVHQTVRSFYCAARKYADLDTEIASGPTQRCIGPQMSHWYILNYTYEFSSIYPDINQWIYLHINTAHEATGQHAATLDNDLLEFMQKYLKKFGETHELAIFLQADHGMRYGNWFQEIEAYQESKLPAFFLISSSSLLARIPSVQSHLLNNTLRLTTKKDLRPTINYLADMPYGTQTKKPPEQYLNFFTESGQVNRTCEDLKISPFQCSCLVVKEIFGIEKNLEFHRLALKLVNEAILYMNRIVNTPSHGDFGVCRKLTFDRILNSYGLILNSKVEELQFKFKVNESKAAVFEVFAFVGNEHNNPYLGIDQAKGTVVNFVYRGFKTRIRMVGVQRKDKYAGKCEDLTRSLYIKSEYCICKDYRLMKNEKKVQLPIK